MFVRWASLGWIVSSLSAFISACNNSNSDLSQTQGSTTAGAGNSSLINDGFVQVGTLQELSQKGSLEKRLQGSQVLIIQDQSDPNTIHALEPVCTHRSCNVDWRSADSNIFCSCHGSKFSANGEVIGGPAVRPLKRYEVTVDQDAIFVQLS